jgi:hypothetical protein
MNEAARTLMRAGCQFRGLTVTLGPDARNRDIGKYWHRFVMSLKKAGYHFDYLWVKEFQKNGKLHLHALITAFIPWNVIKYYWRMATDGTSYIVWIANAQVSFTAAYMAKYMTKDMLTAPFRKGERRYSMSKGIRSAWPKLNKAEDGIQYDFTYKPDDSRFLKAAHEELAARIKRRHEWSQGGDLKLDKGKKRHRIIYKKYKPKHDKNNINRIHNYNDNHI